MHHPINRKALNYLTWHIWFSLTNNNLLMLRLPALCCKTPIYPGSSPRLLVSSLRVAWNAASQAWSPKNSRRIKHNSQKIKIKINASVASHFSLNIFLPVDSLPFLSPCLPTFLSFCLSFGFFCLFVFDFLSFCLFFSLFFAGAGHERHCVI